MKRINSSNAITDRGLKSQAFDRQSVNSELECRVSIDETSGTPSPLRQNNNMIQPQFFAGRFLVFAFSLTVLLGQSRGQDIHWSDDGKQGWYQQQDDTGKIQFHLIDTQQKSSQLVLDQSWFDQQNGNKPVTGIYSTDQPKIFLIQSGRTLYRIDNQNKTSELLDPALIRQHRPRLFLPPKPGPRGKSTHITMENQTDHKVETFWVSETGKERAYEVLAPGQQIKQQTYVGHVWYLKRNGKPIGCFTVRPDDHVVFDKEFLDDIQFNSRPRAQNSRPLATAFTRRDPRSPDRRWEVQVRDHNLWIESKGDNSSKSQLTLDGTEENTFRNIGSGTRWLPSSTRNPDQCDVRWSPDSKRFIAHQTPVAPEHRVYYIESKPKNQLQPLLRSYQYPKPGDTLLSPRLRLFSVESKTEIPVSNQLFDNPFWTRFLGWSKSGDRFRILYNARGHQKLRLLEINANDGSVKTLIEETSQTFIHYSDSGKSTFRDLPGNEILWASERSGWNHLYRYDRDSGKLINAVTSGNWNVKRIHKIDMDQETIWFYAVGIHHDQDPYHEHFCRVKFDGSNLKVLTIGDGTHQIQFQPKGDTFVDTYSRVDMAPVRELRDSQTGKLIAQLNRQDTEKQFGKRRLTERFVAKGRDGETDIWGIIHWPINFDPSKKYPVVENIYAGPHDHHVPKAFRTGYGHRHAIADAGMIVVQIDGMGTAWRSKEFHDVCFKNLRDAGFPDRIAWLKAAAKRYPQMDLSRVGIYGGSAGGQNAMAALLWHSDFYKVAVADCGCHDNRMDKIWWNEQWMGWPVDESYRKNSNMENAHLLNGKLMLTLGELDQNVDPASTTQVVGKLIEHDKDFEFVLIAGKGHGAGESPWAAKKRLRFLKLHLGVE